jgi:hypothetical protein
VGDMFPFIMCVELFSLRNNGSDDDDDDDGTHGITLQVQVGFIK